MALADILQGFAPATLPPEAEALRAEIKAFLAEHLAGCPPHRRARTWTAWDAGFSRALARKGWVGLTLPRQYGGGGRDAFARFVLVEELLAAGAPVAAHWIGDRQSGPLLLKFGSQAQRERFIPAICRSEAFFCIGMSEPGAGSDLASVRTRAERVPGGWRLDGSKIWTTYAHKADWMIALVRTSGVSGDRQRGLSQILVDLKAPGVTIRPITLLTGDSDFSEVHFDNVLLSDEALVGTEGDGWAQVNAELAFERSGPERIYSSLVLLDLWTEHLRSAEGSADGVRLGRFLARLAALRAMSVALTAQLAAGRFPVVEAALLKDLGTELEQAIPRDIADAVAADPDSPPDAELMRTLAFLMQISAVFSLRGGTREILRGMIARGLGLR
ncbi:MAG: acyl-CoA dehydrogenase family protein [Sandarakinorhabdus sp.]|nr:acyl-CoA dehydrogenase family protein [Sandarakinorhabdus sp.]